MNPKELLDSILEFVSKEGFPDIHFNSGEKVKVRNKSGDIESLDIIFVGDKEVKLPVLPLNGIKGIIIAIAGESGFSKFESDMELDTSYSVNNKDRYRVNCYVDTDGYSIAMRRIPNQIPTLDDLGLGDNVEAMCNKSKGLILVTGPTGSGKSTNMAAMIDYINKNHKKHIITIEDPVEFSIKSDKSLINQREIGSHTKGYANAIRASLREDPDVIMIGEMRDPETIKAAITLAETGHLVISTLHTNDSVQTVDRIVDVFPGPQQKQIRMQLAMSLVGIVSQRLVSRIDKEGRIAAREILVANDAVRNLIIQGKTHQLYSVLEIGKKEGMVLMDKYLMALYSKEIISKDTLMSFVRDKEGTELMIN